MTTLAPFPVLVKRTPLAVPTVAESALADRLAFSADGGDPDAYTPDWAAGAPYEPTLADRWANLGYELGRGGSLPTPEETFPAATERDMVDGGFAFSEGVHAGFAERASRVGYRMGLAGADCERPDSIPARFSLDFECGWGRGDDDRSEREQIMGWDYDLEHERWVEEQHNREMEGYPFVLVPGWPLQYA